MLKRYRLTWPQESILLTEKYYNISQVNNVGTKLGVIKGFIPELFQKAVYLMFHRYDVFKIRILEEDGKIYQVFDDEILENLSIPIVYLETEKELKKYLQETIDAPFDISKYMARASIYICKNGKRGYIGAYHHIVNDGFSQYLVSDTIFRIYEFLLKIYSYTLYENGNITKLENAGIKKEGKTKEEYENEFIRAKKSLDIYIDYLSSLKTSFKNEEIIQTLTILKQLSNISTYINNNCSENINLDIKLDIQKEIVNLITSVKNEELLNIFEIYYDEKVKEGVLENFGKKIDISNLTSVPKYVNQLEKEEEYKEGSRFKKDEEYWKEEILKQPKIVSLTKKRKLKSNYESDYEKESTGNAQRENEKLLKAARIQFPLNSGYLKKLHAYCKKNNVTPFNFFMGIYAIYMAHMTLENTFAIATPVLNRANREERKIPGMFVSTLPYITNIDGNANVDEYIKEVKSGLSKILRHQKYPYNMILKESKKVQNTNSNIYTVLLSYQMTKRDNSDIFVSNYDPEWIHSTYNADELDIHVYDIDGKDNFSLAYDYQLNKFGKEDIVELHERVVEMSENILDGKYEKISEVEVTTKKEREEILKKYNNFKYSKCNWGTSDFKLNNQENLMIDFLKRYNSIKLKINNSLAVVDNVTNEDGIKYTYEKFYDLVLKRAKYLEEKGVKAKDKVIIIADANTDAVINIYATLALGATYIPIDENYPKERILYILEDSKAKTIITSKAKQKELNFDNLKEHTVIDIEVEKNENENQKEKENEKKAKDNFKKLKSEYVKKLIKNLEKLGEGLAYIIYTSGSTSNPKGVKISNNSLYKYITWAKETYVKREKTNFPLYSSISFDLTVTSIFTPIYTKNTMYIYDKKDILKTLKQIMENKELDILKLTPAHLKLINMFEEKLLKQTKIKKMIVGGDILSNVLCSSICSKISNLKIFNEYGPTETTVGIMEHIYDKKDSKYISVPIGIPAKESMIYLVNQFGRIVPKETFGEMVIETKSIFDGYVNLKEKTEATRKKSNYTNNMMYLTGDIAIIHDNLMMEYIGRKDFQVKINGYRIELGEVSAQILKHKNILECYVKVSEDKKQIIVYYTLNEEIYKKYEAKQITEEEISEDLKEYLKKYLMPYMIPETYILLPKMPLTINGKIDKKKLPKIEKANVKDLVLPNTKIEKMIVEELEKISKQKNISIKENIFKYGIDSLDVINMQIQLTKKGINIPTQKIYNLQTIENIAKYVEEIEVEDDRYKGLEKYSDISYAKKALPSNIQTLIENKKKAKAKEKENEKENEKVLIFGSTGFLGVHILKEFLTNTEYDINVLVRDKKGVDSTKRIHEKLKFYFGKEKIEKYIPRITVFKGDILKENFGLDKRKYEKLAENTVKIVSTAAIVKHFGDEELFIKTNIEGTNRIIEFAKNFKIPLHYVSTLTVSGYGMVKTKKGLFTEDTLYIGQKYLDNIYVRTKFESEKNIIDAVEKNEIIASIYRVGNITNREIDYKFQENMEENAFTNRIKTLLELKQIPKEILSENVEFAPVDKLANIIMNLSMNRQKTLDVYNIQNIKYISLAKIIEILKEMKIDIEYVSLKDYMDIILQKPEKYYGIINYISMYKNADRNDIVQVDSKQTQYLLKENNLEFNNISSEYIQGVIKQIQDRNNVRV